MGAPEKYYSSLNASLKLQDNTQIEDLKNWAKPHFRNGRYHLAEKELRKNRYSRLLEIGCGGAEPLFYMSDFVDRCVGADISLPPHLKAWQSERILFKEFNADSPFPFENESFDVVVAMMVIEHVFDPFLFVQEAARCLRPGGVFIFNVPLITGFRNRLRVLFGGIPVTSQVDWFEKRVWDGAHLHYFSVPLVKRLVATAGFSVEETNGVGKLKALKDMFPTFLANEASFIARK